MVTISFLLTILGMMSTEGWKDRNKRCSKKRVVNLYDNVHHTDDLSLVEIYFDITYLLAFDDVPPAIQKIYYLLEHQ